jgi:Raf kinase inhibitor-like YbhB/YbcL family protein
MGLAHDISKTIGHTMQPIRAGDDKLASRRLMDDRSGALTLESSRTIDVFSSAFTDGGTLPLAFTADGANLSPPLSWSNLPDKARSVVLVCEDPDAPFPKPFVHWLVYSLPVTVGSIADAPGGVRQGKNSMLKTGYTGAAPPPGHGMHHYHFQVFALDTIPKLDDGAGRSSVVEAMRGHVLAWGEIVATYERS